MMRLLQWAGESGGGDFVLLISTDGKYGAIGTRTELEKPEPGSKIVYIDELFAPLSRIKEDMRFLMARDPKAAAQLNTRAFQKAIPDRIFFRTGAEFGPGVISAEVWDATNNIESASDDALVWIKMLGVNPKKGLTVEVVDRALSELELRIAKGYGLHSTFFPVTEVTMKEIGARGRRAQRGMESFLTKFPSERDLQLDEDQVKERRRQVERYRSRLSNDRLVEVIVFLSFKADWLGDSYKTFLGEFYDRAARGGE
jgi:hypothetical protein